MNKIALPLFILFVISITAFAQRKIIDTVDYDPTLNAKSSMPIKAGITKKKEYLPETSVYQPWPDPSINFVPFTAPLELGDINGDGFSDISTVYKGVANDKTIDPNDLTYKSLVYFGANQELLSKELYYYAVYPAGDINGDGINDIVALDNTSARIKYGSSTGFVDSNIPALASFIPAPNDYTVTNLPFFDFDKDGFQDFAYINSSSEIVILWGNSTEALIVSTNTAELVSSISAIMYEGSPIITACYGSNTFKYITINTDRTLTVRSQSLFIFSNSTFYFEDIDGDGQREFFSNSFLYSGFSNLTGIDNSATQPLYVYETLTPIGDLNKDNKFDFLLFNDDSNAIKLVNITKTNPYLITVLATIPSDTKTHFVTANTSIKSDFNKDGKEDVLFFYSNDPLRGFKSLSYKKPGYSQASIIEYTIPSKIITYKELVNVGDMNKDGSLEMAAVTDKMIYIYSDGNLENPIHTISIPDKNLMFLKLESADLNNDGFSDFVAEAAEGYDDINTCEFQFFYGGTTLPNAPLKRLNYAESVGINILPNIYEVTFSIIGSVDGDEYPELIASSQSQPDTLYLYKGAANFPSYPTRVFNYATNFGNPLLSTKSNNILIGSRAFNLGDLNGDGYKEFMLVDSKYTLDGKKRGDILIFNGNETLDFSMPSKVLLDNRDDRFYFGLTTTVGDFNGDSKLDIATCPYGKISPPSKASPILSIYFGGATISDIPDKELYLISKNSSANNQLDTLYLFLGHLIAVPDINGDKADELVVLAASNKKILRHLILGGDYMKQDSIPAGEFIAPSRSSLGPENAYFISDYTTPVMNFTGRGVPELICNQKDLNYMGDALHRFAITNPFNSKPPTSISLSNKSVAENSSIGTIVGTFSTADADPVDSHRYELIAGNGTNDAGNSKFEIAGSKLKTKVVLDYNTSATHNIYVRSTDANGLSISMPFTINVTVNTGINMVATDGLSLYPNPASNEINIAAPLLNTPVQITMFDLLGRVVLKETHNSNNTITIKLHNQEKGIYIIQVYANGKIWKKKIVIN